MINLLVGIAVGYFMKPLFDALLKKLGVHIPFVMTKVDDTEE
jgi:hypothetical protein